MFCARVAITCWTLCSERAHVANVRAHKVQHVMATRARNTCDKNVRLNPVVVVSHIIIMKQLRMYAAFIIKSIVQP